MSTLKKLNPDRIGCRNELATRIRRRLATFAAEMELIAAEEDLGVEFIQNTIAEAMFAKGILLCCEINSSPDIVFVRAKEYIDNLLHLVTNPEFQVKEKPEL